jgi:hypothetical protein
MAVIHLKKRLGAFYHKLNRKQQRCKLLLELKLKLSPLGALRPRNSQPVFGGLVDELVRLGIRQPVG